MTNPDEREHERASRRAFTLVEMLVVVALIIILLSLLIVGLNSATRTAQSAKTTALMQTISQALVQFERDIGYYPPVLDDWRVLREGPALAGSGDYAVDIQNWYSRTSLAEYLIGYGRNTVDGYGNPDLGESPFTGIRHPGRSGAWGAAPGGDLSERNPVSTGKVYGPYLELDDPRLIGSIDDDGVIRFPGDKGYQEPLSDGSHSKVICDYWGEPIRYYRRNYPPGALGQSYRATIASGLGASSEVPTLSDVILLRPYSFVEGAGSSVRDELADARGDASTSVRTDTGEFALFSPGADRQFDAEYRVDDGEVNKDNLHQVGP